jgi:hypothetical protein
MRRILLISILIVICANLSAQDVHNLNSHKKSSLSLKIGDFGIYPVAQYSFMNKSFGALPVGGAKIRMFYSDRFSFDSDLMFGQNIVRFGAGIAGLLMWIGNIQINTPHDDLRTAFARNLFLCGILLMGCEHFSYHHPIGDFAYISPYISLLRIEHMTKIQDTEPTFATPELQKAIDRGEPVQIANFALGIELNHYFKKFLVSSFMDFQVAYNTNRYGLNFGISLGYIFARKK